MRKLCVHRKHSAGSAVPVNTEYCAATFELPLFVFHQTIFTLYVLILASVCVCMCSPLVSSVSISPCVYVSLSFGIHKENTVITLCSCGSNNNIILLFFRLLLLLLLLPLVCCLAFHIACMSIISSNEKKRKKAILEKGNCSLCVLLLGVRCVCCCCVYRNNNMLAPSKHTFRRRLSPRKDIQSVLYQFCIFTNKRVQIVASRFLGKISVVWKEVANENRQTLFCFLSVPVWWRISLFCDTLNTLARQRFESAGACMWVSAVCVGVYTVWSSKSCDFIIQRKRNRRNSKTKIAKQTKTIERTAPTKLIWMICLMDTVMPRKKQSEPRAFKRK